MSQSANVRSIEAVRQFAVSVLQFQEDARQCVSALETQIKRILGWLERDRPAFWKREIEKCHRDMAEARVRLHQCRMRRHGDFRPTCFVEKKMLEKCQRDHEFAVKQLPVVKRWCITAHHEANEYFGRASQLTQILEREIPVLMALLHQSIERLESYAGAPPPGVESPPTSVEKDRDGAAADPSNTAGISQKFAGEEQTP